jgi:hypothetical protein
MYTVPDMEFFCKIFFSSVDVEANGLLVNLEVVLPDDYPSCAPPQYQLSAPFLRGTDREGGLKKPAQL